MKIIIPTQSQTTSLYSYYMTHNKKILINSCEYYINIHFADWGTAKIELIGKYVGFINNSKIVLNDVLYVPSFKLGLFSIDHLNEENYKIIFWKNRINNKNYTLLYNNKGKRIYTSYSNKSKV